MLQTLANHTAPELIDASEDCMLTVWQERYPDRWLLVEVTGEDDGDPLTGRLLAVAATDMAQVELPSFRAGILDLGPLRLGIQAILGVNVLAGRRLQVDSPEGRLYLLQ